MPYRNFLVVAVLLLAASCGFWWWLEDAAKQIRKDRVRHAQAQPDQPKSWPEDFLLALDQTPDWDSPRPLHLVIYATPNGSTLAHTFGRPVAPGDNAKYNLQHIAAQAQWVRQRLTEEDLLVACVQPPELSWPAWRKKHDPLNVKLAQFVTDLAAKFSKRPLAVTLTGHSGGGSFIFGALDGWKEIPSVVTRIAFLDANYGYESAKHASKLRHWLENGSSRHLLVLAYNDSIAQYQGRPVASATGGTWGRTEAMKADFMPLTLSSAPPWDLAHGYAGRLEMRQHPNPDKKVLHTALVEGNGLIHALLHGTPLAEKEYQLASTRTYSVEAFTPVTFSEGAADSKASSITNH